MEIYILSVFFIFGLIFGSFLNVVLLRFNTGKGLDGRSACMSCGAELNWNELIPVFSFAFQKGRCKHCKAKISWQYPLVEIATGALFSLSYGFMMTKVGLTSLQDYVALIFLLIIIIFAVLIFVYDMRHKIIPDLFSYLMAVAAFLFLLSIHSFEYFKTTEGILDLLAGPILFAFFFAFWFFSRGKAMGLGDAKLALGMGWTLGFVYSISSLLLAFIVGAIFSLALMFIGNLKLGASRITITMKSEIPFGPFLILAMFLTLFAGLDITGLADTLSLYFL